MPARIQEVNIFAAVTGEKPLWNVGKEGGQQFVPDWAKVIRTDGKVSVLVSGPLLNAKGEPYKTKRGLMSFDLDDQGDNDTPAYVLELLIRARDL